MDRKLELISKALDNIHSGDCTDKDIETLTGTEYPGGEITREVKIDAIELVMKSMEKMYKDSDADIVKQINACEVETKANGYSGGGYEKSKPIREKQTSLYTTRKRRVTAYYTLLNKATKILNELM